MTDTAALAVKIAAAVMDYAERARELNKDHLADVIARELARDQDGSASRYMVVGDVKDFSTLLTCMQRDPGGVVWQTLRDPNSLSGWKTIHR